MEKKNLMKLRKIGRNLDPIIRVGKSGLTDELINEAIKHVKRRKIIKIKFLKTAIDEKSISELTNDLISRTKSELVCVIGLTVIISRSGADNEIISMYSR